MKYNLTTVLMLSLSCLLLSCRKEASYLIVSGGMTDSTTQQPITYTTFVLYCLVDEGFLGDQNVQKIILNTDRNGKFSTLLIEDGFSTLKIVWPDDAHGLLYSSTGSEIISYNKRLDDGQHKIELGEIKTSLKKRL